MGSRRTVVVAALVIVAIFLVCLRWCRRAEPGEPVAADRAPGTARTTAPPAPTLGSSPEPVLASGPEVVIDGIDVEKRDLCAGEETVITVRAHAVRPEDAPDLQVQVDGIPGTQVALRPAAYAGADGAAPRVVAFIHPDRRVEMVIPAYRVNGCKADRMVEVVHRPMANAPDQYEFWAKVVEVMSREPLRPVRYRWSFGDGTTAVTSTPIVEKSFRERSQDTLYSQLLVTCTVEGVGGIEVTGHDNVSLLNQAYENLHRKQIVVLQFDKPRFPQLDANGVVQFPVRIWHHDVAPVTITEVHVLRVDRQTAPGAGGPAERQLEMPVEALLHTTSIPPTGITITAKLDTRAEPDVSYYLYRLVGQTDDGTRVAGEFSVMRPTDLPTPERSTPVSDPLLMGKILQAQEILGKQYVTDEDIWRLEREGKIDGKVAPAKLPQKLREPPVGPKATGPDR
jgi:hypothetical protein